MLSASTVPSTPSSTFSTIDNFGIMTPSSQYSPNSQKQNSLNELVETERNYLETLETIDTRISSIWMKQTASTAPEFSELLKHINEISKANKRFYMKLIRMAQSPQTNEEFSKELLHWVDDLEVPYANYCRSYIPNLNQRTDILLNSFITSLIQDLSNDGYEVTLQSLFDAPLQQLRYYKNLYSRLLDEEDQGTFHYRLLTSANKKIDVILTMSQKAYRPVRETKGLLKIQTGFESELKTFESQVDCSRTMDFLGGTRIKYTQFRISNPGSELVMRDNFGLVANHQNGSTVRVHLVLTTEVLVICRELSKYSYSLMYPPIPIGDIVVKADLLERALVGDYFIHFSVLDKRNLVFRANSKETRNTWIGVDQNSPQHILLTPRPLNLVAQKKMLSGDKPNLVRNTDIFTYYSQSGGVSPLESSDEEDNKEIVSPRSRDNHDNTLSKEEEADRSANIAPQSVKILPEIPHIAQSQETFTMRSPNRDKPNVKNDSPIKHNVNEPLKDASHVQMTYIQAPTAQMRTMAISSPSLSSPSSLKPSEVNMNTDKPSSPRSVEVQRAVVPEIMQAVTQNTEEYLETTMKVNVKQTTPRTTSIVPNQKPLPQKPPMPNSPTGYINRPPNQPRPAMQPYGNRSVNGPPSQQQGYRPQYANRPVPPTPGQQGYRPQQQGYRPQQNAFPQQQGYRPQYNNAPSHRMYPGQPNGSSPSLSHAQSNNSLSEEWNSPPHSPSAYVTSNSVKQILYSSNQCDVFHWANQSWYAADGQCLLQVRLTHNNRTCMAVELQNTRQLYLNAWILPNTMIRQPSPTDVSISVFMGTRKENYLVHFPHPQEATALMGILHEAHREASQPSPPSLPEPMLDHDDDIEPIDNVHCPQTLKPVMECKAKLYVQTETSKWNTLGSVSVLISQQAPSMRMMIQIENEKTKLVSAVVRSGNVEKISSKRISFLLSDEAQKTSIVYMIQLREEQTGDKIYEYLRVKNAECGW